MNTRSLILNTNLQGFGQRPAAWRTQPNLQGIELTTSEFWANIGRIAERGKLDAVFFADHPALSDPNDRPLGLVEPFVALAAIAEATESLGLVGSASTTYNDPYDLAERLLSLDVISQGRLAWNAVTTYAEDASKNFGLRSNPDRITRYRRAHEFTTLVRRLWRSAATNETVRHRGEFFSVDGTLNVPPSAQGHPAIFQAGGSPQGRDLASAVADAVFSVELNLEPAIANRKTVKEGARKYGRSPDDVKVIPGLSLVLGSTESEARQRYDEMEALAPDNYTLKTLATYLGDEILDLDMQAPIPTSILDREVDVALFKRSLSYHKTIIEWIRRNNTSLKDILRNFGGYGSRIVVGTPGQVADTIENWFNAGAADGFNLMFDEFPTGLETFVEHVVPLLQNRGLFRNEYKENTISKRIKDHGKKYQLDFSTPPTSPPNNLVPKVHQSDPSSAPGHQWDSAASYGFATQQIYGGQKTHEPFHPRINPIYMTAGYVFDNFADAKKRFEDRDVSDLVYSRSGNPTVNAVENKLAVLENGRNALLVASGQAATHVSTISLLESGDHVLSSPNIYEGSRTLFSLNYRRLGIEVEYVNDPNDPAEWRAKARENTKLFFGETISNPRNDLLDIEGIAAVAHEVGVPLIVDNTLASPALFRPLDYGADIVVHSASKFLTGQGAALSGAIIDSGRFDYGAFPEKYPHFVRQLHANTRASLHDQYGRDAYYHSTRLQIAGSYGPAVSPFNAFLVQQGLETLSIRMKRHSDSALKIASWLEQRPQVRKVDYSGLATNPYSNLAEKYLPHGQGSVFSFTLKGGLEAAEKMINAVRLINRMTHIGDTRTLILHPGTTTHVKLSPEIVQHLGITDGLIRLSVGLEEPEDLIADLQNALNSIF